MTAQLRAFYGDGLLLEGSELSRAIGERVRSVSWAVDILRGGPSVCREVLLMESKSLEAQRGSACASMVFSRLECEAH
jgi:hypothetical protein